MRAWLVGLIAIAGCKHTAATVKLVSGPSDERLNALIGPHKVW